MTFRRLATLLALLPLGGCYVLHTAAGQLDLNARRVPITRVIAAADTPPELRRQLALAGRLRDYATRELGLPDNGSYRSYADVRRPYVVWNVFATAEFSVEPLTWCFPVAGCVAYRGYFAERRARDFALGLEARGFDVAVGGVPAYSTLGHFADPVLNTMLRWDETELAALIFHELSHQLLYVKGDTAFNEAFATVVENAGLERWLRAEGRTEALGAFREREARYKQVAALLGEARARLATLYRQPLREPAMRAAKAAEFARLRGEYAARGPQLGGYEWLFGPALNNALLLSVATYEECVPGLTARLAALDGDLRRFYAEARVLARRPAADRHAALCRGRITERSSPR